MEIGEWRVEPDWVFGIQVDETCRRNLADGDSQRGDERLAQRRGAGLTHKWMDEAAGPKFGLHRREIGRGRAWRN